MSMYNLNKKPRIAITMGDPCGVGPEILVKAFESGELHEQCIPVLIGDPLALRRATALLGKELNIEVFEELPSLEDHRDRLLRVLNSAPLSADDIAYGQPTRRTSHAVIGYIEKAVQLALMGEVDAVCTCPIHKANLHHHGFSFPGHTEFLRYLTRTEDVVMMLAGPRLRVSLVTIHHSLADVPQLLTPEKIQKTIYITGEALLNDFGIPSPHLAIAALNPHAGEEGCFGREEIDLIGPALEAFHESRFKVSGPYPPDTLFHRAYHGEFDAVVSMYHDQGLIPIKLVHFEDAVNVTLGLPIVRTSVDHGTAYDIAGSGRAGEGSLKAAVRLAALMAQNRRKSKES